MLALSFVSWSHPLNAQDRSHIADLLIMSHGGQDILMASTRHDGQLSSWDITGAPQVIDTIDYRGGPVLGSTGEIGVVATVRGTAVISAGGNGNTLQTHVVDANGTLSRPRVMVETASTSFSAMHSFETTVLATGEQMIFGAITGQSGIACLMLSDAGALMQTDMIADTTTSYAGNITATASVKNGGQTFLITASGGTDTGISTWLIGADGRINHAASLSPDTGLWVSDPTTLATAEIDGETFVILGSAGSSSLTVLQMNADGTLSVTDHLLDDLASRFSGVTDVQTVTHHGQTYVVAGGDDDGISLYVLMPNGQLVARAHIEDTTQMGLDNVSAIAVRSNGDGIDIFVSSSSETGITQLRYDSGPRGLHLIADANGSTLQGATSGDLLVGGASADYIVGGQGDDIIRDGAGADTLYGGQGADTFIFDFDSSTDRVRDFTVGVDRIDLSNWPGLRSINQLGFTTRPDGVTITYGTDTLIIQSADGNPIDPASLTSADLLGGVRIPNMVSPGFAAPNPVTPDLPVYLAPAPVQNDPTPLADPFAGTAQKDRMLGGADDDIMTGLGGDDLLIGRGGNDRLDGGAGDDRINGGLGHDVIVGGYGSDVLIGNRGADLIEGGPQRDRIFAGGENDVVYAGAGNDYVNGSTGNDYIFGGHGNDLLKGHTGADRILGGRGNDNIFGELGNDRLYGNQGEDYINGGHGDDRIAGGADDDRLFGHVGNDTLNGGPGRDHISGGSGNDLVRGGSGNDRISGGRGHDHLLGQMGSDRINGNGGNDIMTGGRGRDTFFFNDGRDVITDFDPRFDRVVLDSDLWTGNLSDAAIVNRFGSVQNGNVVLDFGHNDVLTFNGFSNTDALISQIDIA